MITCFGVSGKMVHSWCLSCDHIMNIQNSISAPTSASAAPATYASTVTRQPSQISALTPQLIMS
jgi:hypothetical protein